MSKEKRAAHRPISVGDGAKRRTITIDDARLEKARIIGAGSVSKGLRIALDAFPHPFYEEGEV